VLDLRSSDDAVVEQALDLLFEMVEVASGEDGTLLGAGLRSAGGIRELCRIAGQGTNKARRLALLILGNLSSDAVDPQSRDTKLAMLRCGADDALMYCLEGDDRDVLLAACGTLQNLCSDPVWSERALDYGMQVIMPLPASHLSSPLSSLLSHLSPLLSPLSSLLSFLLLALDYGMQGRLEELLGDEDQAVTRYAAGALQNMLTAATQLQRQSGRRGEPATPSLMAPLSRSASLAVRERQFQARYEAFAMARASGTIARAVRRIPRRVRLQRILLHKEAAAAASERRVSELQVIMHLSVSHLLSPLSSLLSPLSSLLSPLISSPLASPPISSPAGVVARLVDAAAPRPVARRRRRRRWLGLVVAAAVAAERLAAGAAAAAARVGEGGAEQSAARAISTRQPRQL